MQVQSIVQQLLEVVCPGMHTVIALIITYRY